MLRRSSGVAQANLLDLHGREFLLALALGLPVNRILCCDTGQRLGSLGRVELLLLEEVGHLRHVRALAHRLWLRAVLLLLLGLLRLHGIGRRLGGLTSRDRGATGRGGRSGRGLALPFRFRCHQRATAFRRA
eukprot:7382659-Prymnesium_polylepis.1